MRYLLIGLGAFLGANCRYVLSDWAAARFGATFPYGTLIVNVTGSFLIGLFLTLVTERIAIDPAWRLLIAAGFLGGYTTFSSYVFEALALLRTGEYGLALLYTLGSVILGLAAVIAGTIVARVM